MEPTVNKIGKIIKKRRKELNLELKDLQDYSGINYASISDIENGKANPTIKTLEKLLDVIEGIEEMVLKYPEIESLDINPLLLTKDRAVCVDLKVFVRA